MLLALPSTQTDTRTLQVTQQGGYSYTGAAEPGTTYPSGVIETGDTVWTKLARQLTVSFAQHRHGPGADRAARQPAARRLGHRGRRLDRRRRPVGPSRPEDGTGTASVVVDPAAAAALLSRHYAEIGGTGGGATLTVTPVVG